MLDVHPKTTDSVGVDADSLAVYARLTAEWKSTQRKSVEMILKQANIIDRAYQQADIEDQANTGKGKFGSVTVRPGFNGFLRSINMGERTAKEYRQVHRSTFLKDVPLCANYAHIPSSLKVLLQLSRIEVSDCLDDQHKREEFAEVLMLFEAHHVKENAFVTVAIAMAVVDDAIARLTGNPKPERVKTTLKVAGPSIPVPRGAKRVLIERVAESEDDDVDEDEDEGVDDNEYTDEDDEVADNLDGKIRDEEQLKHVKMTARVMANFKNSNRANELRRRIANAVFPILRQYKDIAYCVQLYKLGEALEPESVAEELATSK